MISFSPWRYVLAVSAATLSGSVIFAGFSAADIATAENAIFTPVQTFRLVFLYSLILSLPVVALAIAVFAPITRSLAPARGVQRWIFALFLGAIGGILISIPVAALLMDDNVWAAVAVGLIWGLSSAAAGMVILPTRHSGEESA